LPLNLGQAFLLGPASTYGVPLRLRIEQQLGYKMAKYIRAIEIVDSFAEIAGAVIGRTEVTIGLRVRKSQLLKDCRVVYFLF
jgi:DMSO/TMAO reductase YedYZ molybdopterin-dependent catalytic subunit